MNAPSGDVDIFWDFGSCPVSTDYSGYSVVNKIRSLALRLGQIKSFKAYLPVSEHNSLGFNGRALALRSELQSSGVSLIDAPGGIHVADKMLIVDMLAHAFDRPESSNIAMLISSNSQLAYALSVLRMRNLCRVALLGEDLEDGNATLAAQGNLCLDWHFEIMDGIQPLQASSQQWDSRPVEEDITFTPSRSKAPSANAVPDPEMNDAETQTDPLPEQKTIQEHKGISQNDTSSVQSNWQPPFVRPVTLAEENDFHNRGPSPQIQPATPKWQNTNTGAQAAFLPKECFSPEWSKEPEQNSTLEDWVVTPPASSTRPPNGHGNPPEYSTTVPPTSGGTQGNLAVSREFIPLVEILRSFRGRGVHRPLRGAVAFDLIKANPLAYKNAGLARFSQYSALAAEKKIVELGGVSGAEWIRLRLL